VSRQSHTGVFPKTPPINTVQYTAGDVVGGLMNFSQAAGPFSNAVIQSITVKDKANQKAALTLLFFREAPTGIPVNNAALDITSADMAKLIGKVNVAASDYETLDSQAVATVYPGLVVSGHADTGLATDASNIGNLWMVAVTTGTPTYTAADDLSFELGSLQD
jgi:hypothetical protein